MTFQFFWAPEGRRVVSITAWTLKQAKGEFYRRFPQYKKYKGEVYIEVSL